MNGLVDARVAGYEFSSVSIMPINAPHNAVEHDLVVEKNTQTMERRREWSGVDGIGRKFGEDNKILVETELSNGGKVVVEVGAGLLNASRELAAISLDNTVIAVEPFISPGTLEGLPDNLQVIAKTVHDVTDTDIPPSSVDILVSGGYTINYPLDKLDFINQVYKWLKVGGCAFIEYSGSLSDPSPNELIKKFGLQEVMWIEHSDETGLSSILCLRKKDGIDVNFRNYEALLTATGSGGPGDAVTQFKFF